MMSIGKADEFKAQQSLVWLSVNEADSLL